MGTCGVTDVFDAVCDVSDASMWMAGCLSLHTVWAVRREGKIWGRGGGQVYKFVVDDGERRGDLKWLKCFMLLLTCVS